MANTSHQREAKRVLLKKDPGPTWICFFCKKRITTKNWATIPVLDPLVVHHKDECKWNNEPENLEPAHNSCHNSYHAAQG